MIDTATVTVITKSINSTINSLLILLNACVLVVGSIVAFLAGHRHGLKTVQKTVEPVKQA